MKIWINTEKGSEKIIAFNGKFIYQGNPKTAEIDDCVFELKMNRIPSRNFMGIPLHYLKQINLQEDKEYIEIIFGAESYEHFRVKNSDTRNEIFEYFKMNIPDLSFSTDHYSRIKAGKAPLIAMIVITVFFLITLIYAFAIENGNQYDVTGGHYASFAAIILTLASLGVKKTILIFGSLLSIALIAFIRKSRNPPVINRLTVQR